MNTDAPVYSILGSRSYALYFGIVTSYDDAFAWTS